MTDEIVADALIRRINRLETEDKDLEAQQKQLSDKRERLQGRLEEMWEWLHAHKDKGDYGEHMRIGDHKPTIKLPTFGDRSKLEEAIEQRGKSVAGYSEGEARAARIERARTDGQTAVDEIVTMPEDDWPWLPVEKSPPQPPSSPPT